MITLTTALLQLSLKLLAASGHGQGNEPNGHLNFAPFLPKPQNRRLSRNQSFQTKRLVEHCSPAGRYEAECSL